MSAVRKKASSSDHARGGSAMWSTQAGHIIPPARPRPPTHTHTVSLRRMGAVGWKTSPTTRQIGQRCDARPAARGTGASGLGSLRLFRVCQYLERFDGVTAVLVFW